MTQVADSLTRQGEFTMEMAQNDMLAHLDRIMQSLERAKARVQAERDFVASYKGDEIQNPPVVPAERMLRIAMNVQLEVTQLASMSDLNIMTHTAAQAMTAKGSLHTLQALAQEAAKAEAEAE